MCNAREKAIPDWVNNEIKHYSAHIKDLYVTYKQTNSPIIYSRYKQERKKYRKYVSNYKKSLNENKILNAKNKSKTAWNIINKQTNKSNSHKDISIKYKDTKVREPKAVAELFSKHFNLPFSYNDTYVDVGESITPTIFLNPVNSQEIFNILMNLPNKHSAGLDDIPVFLLKRIASFICTPLAALINVSFSSGVFPSALKVAKLIPILKGGNACLMNNYRPVSLLSSFSKVFERALCDRLASFLDRNSILSDTQYGFRPKKSCHLAIYNVLNFIIERVDRGEKVAGIFFDLSKAFDTLNHGVLLNKLNIYGIRGVAARLLESYLSDRQQLICVTHEKSKYFSQSVTVSQGVPQGSILGPLLFLLYVNDLHGEFVSGLVCQYADDTSLVLTDQVLRGLSGACSQTVGTMREWCRKNSLQLNTSKTGLLTFGKTRDNESLYVSCDNKSIPLADYVKFLGVYIDPTLHWTKHIDILTSKLNSNCAIIRRLRDQLSLDTIRTLYIATSQSLIMYSVMFWGSSALAEQIFRAQKRMIRCMFGLHPRTSCRPYFAKIHVLTVPSLYFLSLVMFVKKHSALFATNSSHYGPDMERITRGRDDLSIPLHSSSFFRRGPGYRAVKAFEMLPANIRAVGSDYHFRGSVLEFLHTRGFYSFNFEF